MSGASVSSTIASAARPAPAARICSARSKVIAPPKPSLKPSSTNASACCSLPLKAWAMPPAPRAGAAASAALSAERRTCTTTGSPNRAPARAGRRRSAPGARGRGPATKWSRPISPTATSRGSSRVRCERVAQRGQVGVAGAIDAHRMDAERVGEPDAGAPARARHRNCRGRPRARRSARRRPRARARRRRRGRRRTRRRRGGSGCRSSRHGR